MEKSLLYLDSQKRQQRRSIKFQANHFRISALKNIHHTYHHKPSEIKSLISSSYLDCKTCIITDKFQSPAIPVRRSVLQGDCLSPLLFNLCFNTFINTSNQINISSLVSPPMMVMTVCFSQYTGFSLLMMLLLLLVEKRRTNSY